MVYFLFVLTIKWVKINLLTWRIFNATVPAAPGIKENHLETNAQKDFFSAIENLLKAGFQPRFYTVNSGRIGLITFTDKNGTKQVPPGRKENIKISYFPEKISNTEKVSWGT